MNEVTKTELIFEGLGIETAEDVRRLADYLDRKLASIGQRVNVIVNYDNFQMNPSASDAFFAMVRHNQERFFLSSTRYSTNAFFRHQLGEQLAQASFGQRVYRSYDEAKEHL